MRFDTTGAALEPGQTYFVHWEDGAGDTEFRCEEVKVVALRQGNCPAYFASDGAFDGATFTRLDGPEGKETK